MTETDKAYIAGIIDGEGSIGLWKNHQGIQRKGRTPSYCLRVRVKMTDEMLVCWLHTMLGGRLYWSEVDRFESMGWKGVYEWSCVGVKAIEVLTEIYPYLKIKKGQADIAFRFGKTLNLVRGKYGVRMPDEIIVERELLRREIRVLNKRGL